MILINSKILKLKFKMIIFLIPINKINNFIKILLYK
jgi:hypothetical protein